MAYTVEGDARPVARTAAQREHEVRHEMRLTKSWWSRAGILLFVVAAVAIPLDVGDPFLLSLGATSSIYAVGAIGLNLLTGYAGQISVGHSFFVSVGAFTALAVGVRWDLPLPLWILGSALVGGIVGAAIGPFALRLRGLYQIVLTLGLVYVGSYVFTNWTALSGGNDGVSAPLPMKLGPLDFGALKLGNVTYSYAQGLFVLSWLMVGLSLLLVHNVVRSRSGRAMIAVRDGELAAEVAGLSPVRVKVSAFALSGALAAVCGALLVAQIQYVNANQFTLAMSIQFIVMIIVGGVGTTWGPVIGAIVISALPLYITQYAASIPFVRSPLATGVGFGIKPGELSLIVYGALLVLFVLLEPRGLAYLIKRAVNLVRRPKS